MRTAVEIAAAVNAGASAVTELERSLAMIDARNDELNVFLHVDVEGRAPPRPPSTRGWREGRTPERSRACPWP